MGTPSTCTQCVFYIGNVAHLQQSIRLPSKTGLIKPLGSVLSHRSLIQKLSVLARTHTRTSTYTVTVMSDVRRFVSLSSPHLPPPQSLAAAHSQSARITPRSDLQGNNFEVQMGENIISTGLTPDPVAVARLPDASQRLESSVSGDLPLLQTWRWVWRRGRGITTVCAGRRNSQSHISETPYSHQRRQRCLISFQSIFCLATKYNLNIFFSLPVTRSDLQTLTIFKRSDDIIHFDPGAPQAW